MSAKTVTLLIAIASMIATAVAAVAKILPPQWAALIAAIGAGCYAIARGLQKVKEGATFKSLLSTTEAWGTILAILAAIGLAVGGLLDPDKAAGIVLIAGILLKISRVLQASPSTACPRDGGFAHPRALIGMLIAAALAWTVFFVLAAKARAADSPVPIPQIGFCTMEGKLCFQPAVAVSAFQLRLSDMSYSRVMFAAGYGGVYKAEKVNLGAALYFGEGFAKDSPNAPQVDLLFSVADVLTFGPGVETYKDPDGKRVYKALLTAALNLNVFGTPTYAAKVTKAAAAKACAMEGGGQ